MDLATPFCPNLACPARGQAGAGNIRIHSQQDQRSLCPECRKTFTATPGIAFYRLRTAAETVTLVVTLLAHESLCLAGGKQMPAMAAGITDHCWTIRALLSFHVPPPRWTPPKRRGRPWHTLKRLIARWCS